MKEVADLVKRIGDIDLNRKIVALEGEVQDLTRAKRHLEIKIEEQERIIELKKDLKFDAPFYRLQGDPTPYCAACWEGKNQLAIHLEFSHDNHDETRWDCPHCSRMVLLRKNGPRPTTMTPGPAPGPHGWMAR